MGDSAEEISRDVAAIGRIDAVPVLLKLICETTGMGFSAVARVTDDSWTACSVEDRIPLGLSAGDELDVHTSVCKQARAARAAIVIDHASIDPRCAGLPTLKRSPIERYISVPIVLRDGSYFGNLCAMDPHPAKTSDDHVVRLFELFAELVAVQLGYQRQMDLEHSAFLDERAAGELREQFIAMLTHDLRSPLAAILVGSELLVQHRAEEAKVLAITQRIAGSARRMGALIDDVLDFARGRLGGGFDVQLADITDFEQSMQAIVNEVQASYPDRTIRTELLVKGVVRCDRARMQQLVSNLLENALTFGAPREPVHFSARADGNSVVLTVSHEGDPLPPESLAKVFAPFWRRTRAGTRQSLGLGLFISAQIAKAHGGTLDVVSSTHDGTTFAARIPCFGTD